MASSNLENIQLIIVIHEDLDNDTVPHLLKWLKALLLPDEGTIIIDLNNVNRFSTAGLASLIMLYKLTGADIVLINLSEKTKALFDIMRIDERLFKWINVRSIEDSNLPFDPSQIKTVTYPKA